MLAFITATRVQFCIVHKLDRLARNRADDVKRLFNFERGGALK